MTLRLKPSPIRPSPVSREIPNREPQLVNLISGFADISLAQLVLVAFIATIVLIIAIMVVTGILSPDLSSAGSPGFGQ